MYFVKTIQATTAQAIYSYRFDHGGAGSCKYGSFLATSPSKRMLKGALANLGIKVPRREEGGRGLNWVDARMGDPFQKWHMLKGSRNAWDRD